MPDTTAPRGRFRQNAAGDDIALPNYWDTSSLLRGHMVSRTLGPNRKARRNAGRSLNVPRVNEAKRALRAVAL